MRAATACSARREAPGQPDKLERWNGLGPSPCDTGGIGASYWTLVEEPGVPLHYGIAARRVARNEANGGRVVGVRTTLLTVEKRR